MSMTMSPVIGLLLREPGVSRELMKSDGACFAFINIRKYSIRTVSNEIIQRLPIMATYKPIFNIVPTLIQLRMSAGSRLF